MRGDVPMIIDGHNDLVLRTWHGEETLHVDLADAEASGFLGGFFALYVPSRTPFVEPTPPYDIALPDRVSTAEARGIADELLATFAGLDVTIARSVEDFQPGRVTAIMHLEGAEPIEPDLSNLHEWYERGLRSIGLVWSRANAFAEGVPFRFPSSPDTGPGLTEAGRRLVRACNRLGIVLDVSHQNEVGFWVERPCRRELRRRLPARRRRHDGSDDAAVGDRAPHRLPRRQDGRRSRCAWLRLRRRDDSRRARRHRRASQARPGAG
jgi:membrane dipeptidase